MALINPGAFKPTSLDQLQGAVDQCMNVAPGGGAGKVLDIGSEADLTKLQSTGKLVVTDWFATWCGPCNNFKPTFQKMAEEYKDVLFCKIDVDQQTGLAAKHEIRSMPTFKASSRAITENNTFSIL